MRISSTSGRRTRASEYRPEFFNAQSLDDPRDVISVGFVAVAVDELKQGLAATAAPEAVRNDRIDTVIESTTLR